MHRHTNSPALELSFMEETHSWREKCDDGSGAMLVERKRDRGARLVVVFQKPHRFALIIQIGPQVQARRLALPCVQAVVKPFVIGVMETLLLQVPFAVPVCLRHEDEIRMRRGHGGNRLRPKWRIDRRRAVARIRAVAPGFANHVGEEQHRHVAAHAVAALGDVPQVVDHRGAQAGMTIVQLQRVAPAGEVRIAAVRQNSRSELSIIPRLPQPVARRAVDVILGMRLHPRMIQRRVVRHEIEQQAQATLPQSIAQARHCRIPAEIGMDFIRLHRERRTADVGVT